MQASQTVQAWAEECIRRVRVLRSRPSSFIRHRDETVAVRLPPCRPYSFHIRFHFTFTQRTCQAGQTRGSSGIPSTSSPTQEYDTT